MLGLRGELLKNLLGIEFDVEGACRGVALAACERYSEGSVKRGRSRGGKRTRRRRRM